MIVKVGRKWALLDSKGKRVLGFHNTLTKAKAQESAVNISKARKAGYRIPKV